MSLLVERGRESWMMWQAVRRHSAASLHSRSTTKDWALCTKASRKCRSHRRSCQLSHQSMPLQVLQSGRTPFATPNSQKMRATSNQEMMWLDVLVCTLQMWLDVLVCRCVVQKTQTNKCGSCQLWQQKSATQLEWLRQAIRCKLMEGTLVMHLEQSDDTCPMTTTTTTTDVLAAQKWLLVVGRAWAVPCTRWQLHVRRHSRLHVDADCQNPCC